MIKPDDPFHTSLPTGETPRECDVSRGDKQCPATLPHDGGYLNCRYASPHKGLHKTVYDNGTEWSEDVSETRAGEQEGSTMKRFVESELREHAVQLGAIGMAGLNRPLGETRATIMAYIEEHFAPVQTGRGSTMGTCESSAYPSMPHIKHSSCVDWKPQSEEARELLRDINAAEAKLSWYVAQFLDPEGIAAACKPDLDGDFAPLTKCVRCRKNDVAVEGTVCKECAGVQGEGVAPKELANCHRKYLSDSDVLHAKGFDERCGSCSYRLAVMQVGYDAGVAAQAAEIAALKEENNNLRESLISERDNVSRRNQLLVESASQLKAAQQERDARFTLCERHQKLIGGLLGKDWCGACESAEANSKLSAAETLVGELRTKLADALKDADGWKQEHNIYRNAWSREMGGLIRPKTHDIDGFVLRTRDLYEALKDIANMGEATPIRIPKMLAKAAVESHFKEQEKLSAELKAEARAEELLNQRTLKGKSDAAIDQE